MLWCIKFADILLYKVLSQIKFIVQVHLFKIYNIISNLFVYGGELFTIITCILEKKKSSENAIITWILKLFIISQIIWKKNLKKYFKLLTVSITKL